MIDEVLKAAGLDRAKLARSIGGRGGGSTKDQHKAAVVGLAASAGISKRTVERALAGTEPEPTPEPDEPEYTEPEPIEPIAPLPEIEVYLREQIKDVRDMIRKVITHHIDWKYGKRAWLCSKAGSKLAALARKLSRHEAETSEGASGNGQAG